MNDDDRWGHDDRDRVVDEFFAAHRDRVVDHQTDDETWQVIRESAGRGSGRSKGMWFLGGAVAASAVAVAVLVGQGLGGPEALTPAGPGATPDPVVATSPEPDPSAPAESTEEPVDPPAQDRTDELTDEPGVTGQPSGEEPAPETFQLTAPDPEVVIDLVREPTGEGSDLRVTELLYDCEAADMEWDCPALAVSEDAGRTWQPRVDMFAAGYYRAVASRDRIWMWGPAEDAARGRRGVPDPAANVLRSDDGGRTWTEIPTRGRSPIGVEAFRSTLVVVTEGCQAGTADPPSCAEVVITDVAAADALAGRRVVQLEDLPEPELVGPGWYPTALLSATYDAVYVTYLDATYRIADGEEVATRVERPGQDCALATAPESPDTLVSWCVDSDQLHLSPDGGDTWQEVGAPPGDLRSAASNDGQRVAVATADALWVRDGDGADWREVITSSTSLPQVDALGGRSMTYGGPYRYDAQDPSLVRRWSTDDGWQTWTEQPQIEIAFDD